MSKLGQLVFEGRQRQQLKDDAVHGWYQFVLAYPDHLVPTVLERFSVDTSSIILDPFCGTGTTLVECKKLGLPSVGIDANPASVLASEVKTDWNIDATLVDQLARQAVAAVTPISEAILLDDTPLFRRDGGLYALKEQILSESPEAQYLVTSGMLQRGWIDEVPFYVSIALLNQIKNIDADQRYIRLLKLALAACIVERIANVRFGPEIYIVKGSGSHDVLHAFREKIRDIVADLAAVADLRPVPQTTVLRGDSRECDMLLRQAGIERVDYVITSPPYPTEKDYTRNTRLELAYLGFVHDRESLRQVKDQMVRSHSKGIYKTDCDGQLVANLPSVKAIADELRQKVQGKTYGFAKLYPRIIEEYFGGMYRHLRSLSQILRPEGQAAYVVGEQCTYLQTFTPTGTILGEIAELPEIGFRVDDILVWRVRQGTTGSGSTIKEEIVLLRKPG